MYPFCDKLFLIIEINLKQVTKIALNMISLTFDTTESI